MDPALDWLSKRLYSMHLQPTRYTMNRTCSGRQNRANNRCTASETRRRDRWVELLFGKNVKFHVMGGFRTRVQKNEHDEKGTKANRQESYMRTVE